MAANKKHFAYAGDSHVYIYETQTHKLEKILPFCEISVTNIILHKKQVDMIGCLLMDNSFEIWNIAENRLTLTY